MPYTVPVAFDTLLSRLNLTTTQKAIADGRVNHLVAYFTNNIACSQLPFTIGSYDRGSVISWKRDIDAMVALDYPTYKARYDDDPDGMLRWLRDRLDAEYDNTVVSRRGVAIRMFLGDGFQVDLVPTFKQRGGGFLMPDGKGGWRSTNPPYHATIMTDANVALGYDLKPLVRVMKAWNVANGSHLESFHLEMMVWEMWHDAKALPSLPQAVSDTLRKGVTWMEYPIHDPWPGAGLRLDGYLSDDERGIITRRFDGDHERAEQAIAFAAAGQNEKAYDRWDDVFVGRFPAYG